MKHKIVKIDWSEDDIAWAVEMNVPPFGTAVFSTADHTVSSRKLLQELIENWDPLWPGILKIVQEAIEEYGEIDQHLGPDEFIGSISRMTEELYMGDRSDVHLRLEFEEPPRWDFFLKDWSIVHHQPVF